VYAVAAKPVTDIGELAPVVMVIDPSDVLIATTEYPVIAPPPTSAGAVKATDTELTPAVAVPIVGASGTFSGLYPGKTIPA
jgi:hypothetical protein